MFSSGECFFIQNDLTIRDFLDPLLLCWSESPTPTLDWFLKDPELFLRTRFPDSNVADNKIRFSIAILLVHRSEI